VVAVEEIMLVDLTLLMEIPEDQEVVAVLIQVQEEQVILLQ
jgi:hypothetical protein